MRSIHKKKFLRMLGQEIEKLRWASFTRKALMIEQRRIFNILNNFSVNLKLYNFTTFISKMIMQKIIQIHKIPLLICILRNFFYLQGQPEFVSKTNNCHYKFSWKTSLVCPRQLPSENTCSTKHEDGSTHIQLSDLHREGRLI